METNQTYQNELGSAMLPFVMRELVDTVMKRKTLPLEDALYYSIFFQFATRHYWTRTQNYGIQVHYHFMKH